MDKSEKRFLRDRKREIVEENCSVPIVFENLEEVAKEHLEDDVFDHLAGGAGIEDTKRENRVVFQRWRILPRVLHNVSERDLGVRIFDQTVSAPIMLAPIGSQTLYHSDGELATARAASEIGVSLTVSSSSSYSIEEIATEMKDTPRFFQLYWPQDWDIAVNLMARAERANYSGIVLTVDSMLPKWRARNLQNQYQGWQNVPKANYRSDEITADEGKERELDDRTAKDMSLTWEDLGYLREQTSLPVILKGILHPDDARRAVEYDVDGIIVSTHGGRQIDGEIGALDALPAVVDAVDGRVPVLYDSGIRSGSDAFKALALGARAVFLGRPYIYGLAIAGQQGVSEVIQNYAAELESVMGLSGSKAVNEIDSSQITRIDRFEAGEIT